MGQIIYREYIVFRGSNISCSLACAFVFIHALIGARWSSAKHRRHIIEVASVDVISVEAWPPVKHKHRKTKQQVMMLVDAVKINRENGSPRTLGVVVGESSSGSSRAARTKPTLY